MRKKLLSLIISFAMILTMIPAMGSVAYADSSDKPAPAQNLSWDGNIARWDEVEGAEQYKIYIYRDGKESHEPEVVEGLEQNKYNLEDAMILGRVGCGCYSFAVAVIKDGDEVEISACSEKVMLHKSPTVDVINPASFTSYGKMTLKCEDCNVEETRTIPRIASVDLIKSNYTYTGRDITPELIVKDEEGRILEQTNDYGVRTASGDAKSAGIHTCTVKFYDKYEGNTTTVSYTIDPAPASSIKAVLSTGAYTYNGKSKNPTITVTDSEGTDLVKNTDYTVEAPSNGRTSVGTHTYAVKLQGNYTGTKSLSFTIKPATASIRSLSVGKKKMTVKMTTKPSSKGASTYQIAYKQKGTSKWNYTTTTAQSKAIKKLKKGKKYYVKVRAYKKVSGTTYYGAWSKTMLSKKIK